MNIYLAARYGRRKELRTYRDRLVEAGLTVTSRWIDTDFADDAESCSSAPEEQRMDWLRTDVDDLIESDVLIAFTEYKPLVPGAERGGRHVEFGIALAWEMTVLVVGPVENLFYLHEDAQRVQTFDQAMSELLKIKQAKNGR